MLVCLIFKGKELKVEAPKKYDLYDLYCHVVMAKPKCHACGQQ